MWSIAKPLSQTSQGLSQDQVRVFKTAYLMGAKDALRICEVSSDGDLTGDSAVELLRTLESKIEVFSTAVSAQGEPTRKKAQPIRKSIEVATAGSSRNLHRSADQPARA